MPRSSDQRNHTTPSSAHMASELKQCIQCVLPQLTVTFGSDSSYICRSCYYRFEKLLKLRKSIAKIEKETEENVKQAAHLYQPEASQRGEEGEGTSSSSTPCSSKQRMTEDLRTCSDIVCFIVSSGYSPINSLERICGNFLHTVSCEYKQRVQTVVRAQIYCRSYQNRLITMHKHVYTYSSCHNEQTCKVGGRGSS